MGWLGDGGVGLGSVARRRKAMGNRVKGECDGGEVGRQEWACCE